MAIKYPSRLCRGVLPQKAEMGDLVARRVVACRAGLLNGLKELAEPTGLEPATSDVTGRRSNQLNYDSALKLK